jgi:hypothetical protein
LNAQPKLSQKDVYPGIWDDSDNFSNLDIIPLLKGYPMIRGPSILCPAERLDGFHQYKR